MDTKEAIVRVKNIYKLLEDKSYRNVGNKIKEFNCEEREEIIVLLQRGEELEANNIELADENQMLKNYNQDLLKDIEKLTARE